MKRAHYHYDPHPLASREDAVHSLCFRIELKRRLVLLDRDFIKDRKLLATYLFHTFAMPIFNCEKKMQR